jgi:hypothetical protein
LSASFGTDTVKYAGVEQNVGIAISGDEIADLDSELLGGPIGKQLNWDGVIWKPQ